MKNNSIIAERVTEKLLKPKTIWGLSSAGRASALQAEGHRFEPYWSHNSNKRRKIYMPTLIEYADMAQLAEQLICNGGIAQLARAHGSYPWCRWFKSSFRY